MTVTPRTPNNSPQKVDPEPIQTLNQRWTALHTKAGQIAAMADLAPEPLDTVNTRFNDALAQSGILFGNYTHSAALRGIEDMEILVKMGLKALKEVESRGQDAGVPALALWREVYHAREAILTVMEPAAA